MKSGKLNFGFFALVSAIIFAIVFGACGGVGGDLQDLYDGLINDGPGVNYPPGEGPGYYAVGDEGPGGGIIFYYDEDGFIIDDDTGEKANYLEAAPEGWYGTENDPGFRWAPYYPYYAGAFNVSVDTSFEIGTGRKNTALILVAAGGDSSVYAPAANACSQYSTASTAAGDWFLPSRDELAQLYNFHVEANAGSYPGLTTGLEDYMYWSSSQSDVAKSTAWLQWFNSGEQRNNNPKNTNCFVRPVRAF